MNNRAPNFLIVGAAKSGTTSLFRYLKSHPNICMSSMKEPMYFVSDIYKSLSRDDPRHQIADRMVISDFDKYLSLFDKAGAEETMRGEASAAYLYYHEKVIPGIKKYLGDIKIIIILRQPVDRAYSAYSHLVRDGVESATFEEFLEDEDNRKKGNWDILNYPTSLGFYYNQVKAYMDAFSDVKVVLLDDLKRDAGKTMKEIYEFLGVDSGHEINSGTTKVFNQSSVQENSLLQKMLGEQPPLAKYTKPILNKIIPNVIRDRLMARLHEKNKGKPDAMNADTRERLDQLFRDDILRTQALINRDLSCWVRDDGT